LAGWRRRCFLTSAICRRHLSPSVARRCPAHLPGPFGKSQTPNYRVCAIRYRHAIGAPPYPAGWRRRCFLTSAICRRHLSPRVVSRRPDRLPGPLGKSQTPNYGVCAIRRRHGIGAPPYPAGWPRRCFLTSAICRRHLSPRVVKRCPDRLPGPFGKSQTPNYGGGLVQMLFFNVCDLPKAPFAEGCEETPRPPPWSPREIADSKLRRRAGADVVFNVCDLLKAPFAEGCEEMPRLHPWSPREIADSKLRSLRHPPPTRDWRAAVSGDDFAGCEAVQRGPPILRVWVFSGAIIATVPRSIAVSKLRRPFLSGLFIAVRLLRRRGNSLSPTPACWHEFTAEWSKACGPPIRMKVIGNLAPL
jgi:hypothetical protein